MRTRAGNLVTFSCRASLWLVACSLAAGCSGAHEPTQVLPASPRATIAPTANVPALLGASIDDLRAELGSTHIVPANYRDPIAAFVTASAGSKSDSLAAFRTGGLTLLASYNARTRQVLDLVVLGRHEDSLMARASLRANTPNYLLMPVFFADKPSRLMGMRVISTARN